VAAAAFVGAYFLVRAKVDERASMAPPAPPIAAPQVSPRIAAPSGDAKETDSTGALIHGGEQPIESGSDAAHAYAARPGVIAAETARGRRGGRDFANDAEGRAARGARELDSEERSGSHTELDARAQHGSRESDAEDRAAGNPEGRGSRGVREPDAEERSTLDARARDEGALGPRARGPRDASDAQPRPARGRRGAESQPSAAASSRGAAGAAGPSDATNVSTRPLEVGDDLRSLRGARRPRPLSLEDPFR
jgi:hypothetical protein